MLVLGTSAFLVGMRRGGVQGPEVAGVIVLVERFSAAASVGIAVLIFLYADVQATVLLFRKVDWRVLRRLLLPTVAGIGLGAFVGRFLPMRIFEWTFFAILLTAYATLVVQHFRPLQEKPPPLPRLMTPLAGLLSGITSMIGNMASLFVALYFTAIRAEKEQFIATSAWFFFTLNIVKLPIHIWGWRTLTGVMLARTLILFPVVTLGIWLGRIIVHRLNEAAYWRFVVVMVGLALVRLLLVMTGIT